jgi:hypothetical protein
LTILAFIFSLLLVFQQPQTWPQSDPFTNTPQIREEWRRAYAKFKPGPRVMAELEKLKALERDARKLWDDGEYTLQDVNRVMERNWIHRHLLLCMALMAGERDQVPELIVVRPYAPEIMKVFPRGKLPADPLQPNQVYECEPGSKRKVRYLTTFRGDSRGEQFAVFAREAEP